MSAFRLARDSRSLLLAGAISAFILSSPASATSFEFTGSMSGNPGYDVGPISGSFRFSFDDAAVDPEQYTWTQEVALDFLDLSPAPLGNTLFDLANTEALMVYRFGVLDSIFVGGSISGANGLVAYTDDFRFSYRELDTESIELQLAGVVESDSIRIDYDPSATLSISEVPEPSPALLVGLGLLFMRSREQKAGKALHSP